MPAGAPRSLWADAFELWPVRVALVIHALAGAVMLAFPLFAPLGFERSFVHAMLIPPTVAAMALALVTRARERGDSGPLRSALVSFALGCAAVLPSALLARVHEALRTSCDPLEGSWFLAVLTIGGAALASGAGVAAGSIARRRGIAWLLIFGWIVGSLGLALFGLYSRPQIDVYSLAFGHWPGSLYDEDLALSLPIVAHRGLALLVGTSLALMAQALHGGHGRGVELEAFAASVVFALAAMALAGQGEDLGFKKDAATIERALSLKLDGPGFRIHADPALGARGLRRFATEVEIDLAQLERFFGRRPTKRVEVWLYRDSAQKKSLMGASGTQIARPWASEIHIDGFEIPHGSLRHELAHVFAAELATGAFRVPAKAGVLVSVGLVEGIAVAADWPVQEGMSVHSWAKAMRELGAAPNPGELVRPTGFWSVSSSRAYTIAGSFVRYLVDTHGIEAFARAYDSGDLEGAYERPLVELVNAWVSVVEEAPLEPEQLALAEARFSRPSVFEKVCPHTTSTLASRAAEELSLGDVEGALELYRRVVAYDPQRSGELVEVARTLGRTGRVADAERILLDLEALPLGTRRRSEARGARADLAWRTGQRDVAVQLWRSLVGLPGGERRLVRAKLEATARPPPLEELLRAYLLGDLSSSESLLELDRLARETRSDGLVRYLYARRLESSGLHASCLQEIRAAQTSTSPALPASFRAEARRMEGRALFALGEASEAAAWFEELARSSTGADSLVDLDWAERARASEARTSSQRSSRAPRE
ncbi:MAG: tetratricopeptide repeat protein [Deltaproteobacteria bacterium]|nr:tetratricopeptide repeat protein [Deltaproteobacteria bacterium]